MLVTEELGWDGIKGVAYLKISKPKTGSVRVEESRNGGAHYSPLFASSKHQILVRTCQVRPFYTPSPTPSSFSSLSSPFPCVLLFPFFSSRSFYLSSNPHSLVLGTVAFAFEFGSWIFMAGAGESLKYKVNILLKINYSFASFSVFLEFFCCSIICCSHVCVK